MIRTTIYLPLGRAAGLGVSQFDSSRTRAVAAMMPAWHERLQTSLIMGTRNSGYDRAGQNWYQEPPQCAQVLFDEVPFAGGIHDPYCGKGTIVRVALGRGIEATGADIEDRADGCFPQQNFFTDEGRYPNIAFNPPNDRRRGLNMLAARLDPAGAAAGPARRSGRRARHLKFFVVAGALRAVRAAGDGAGADPVRAALGAARRVP